MTFLTVFLYVASCLCVRIAATTGESCAQYNTSFFTQKLDHASNTSTTTFQQEYQIDTSRFKPGGPILFFQGDEETTFQCLEYFLLDDMAEELGAIVCGLEHRFFGQSFPSGVSAENVTTEDFKTLTLDNVIADSVNFVQWVQNTVPDANNSRVIINGGSYGGTLATAARLMYPDVFFASWPSAPLLRSFGSNLDANDDKYNWEDWIANVYQDGSAEASSKISQALYELDACSSPGANCSDLLTSLRLCDQGPNNATEWADLYAAIMNAYGSAAQFSYATAIVWPLPNFFQVLINQTLLAGDSGSVLRIPGMFRNWQLDYADCLDWRSENLTSVGGGVGIELGTFDYITCVYLPAVIGPVPNGSIFPPQLQSGTADFCPPEWQNLSSLSNLTNQQAIDYYGFTAENIEKIGRFFFTQGGYDPTTSVGPPPLQISALVNASRAMIMPGIAHTEEVFGVRREGTGLSVELDQFRSIITEHIKGWLAEP